MSFRKQSLQYDTSVLVIQHKFDPWTQKYIIFNLHNPPKINSNIKTIQENIFLATKLFDQLTVIEKAVVLANSNIKNVM